MSQTTDPTKHTLFEVEQDTTRAEMNVSAPTELFVAPFPSGAGEDAVTPTYADKVPGLYGDFSAEATDEGETTPLADGSSVFTPGAVTLAEKTLTIKAKGDNTMVQRLWAHATTNKKSATSGKALAYNLMHADRSGWYGLLQVKSMTVPTDGSFEHRITIQYLNRNYIAPGDNPPPVVP